MTEQAMQHYEEDEISLLDILVTLAGAWKLLVFGPLVAGVVAGVLSFAWPKTFESVAIVRLTEEEVALLYAAPVLDPLIEKFGLLAEADGIVDDARQDLKKRLTFSVDKKTKLATITAKARTQDAAQALGSSAIDVVLKELQVKGQEKVLIEKIIVINNRTIERAEDALDSIQRSLKKGGQTDQAQESAIKNMLSIYNEVAKRSRENEELRQKLEPKGAEVLVQEAGLPQRKVSPKLGLVVLLAIFTSAFILLIFVFIRKAWLEAMKDEKAALKVRRIEDLLFAWRLATKRTPSQ